MQGRTAEGPVDVLDRHATTRGDEGENRSRQSPVPLHSNSKENGMYSPQQAETIIHHHTQHTARLVERSRVRVPNRTVRNRLAVWAFRRQAG